MGRGGRGGGRGEREAGERREWDVRRGKEET